MAENVDEKLCFLVGPIGDPGTVERNHADWLHDEIVAPVFEQHFENMRVERADKITEPGMIDSQVITRLLEAKLVVADMSFLNPNAFYEIGIRHLKRLPIIHMFLEGSPIPFDVKPYRAIPFKLTNPQDLREARKQLRAHVQDTLQEGFVVENPVTRARGYQQLDQHATAAQRVLLDELRNIKGRVAMLEARDRSGVTRDALVKALLNKDQDTGTTVYSYLPPPSDRALRSLLTGFSQPLGHLTTTTTEKTTDQLLAETKNTLEKIEKAHLGQLGQTQNKDE